MKHQRTTFLILATSILLTASVPAAPAITGVTAQQRHPWDGKVDITYTVSGDIIATAQNQGRIPSLKVTATDQETGTSYTATSLSGNTGLTDGAHSLVWDMAADGLTPLSTNMAFSVSCKTTQATYCVIDLSAGSSASSYPVTYLAEPPSGGFNVDEYKTTKLVLKRIEAGTFIMGEDQTNTNHRVTLTKPFFIGVFEVTQKQYQLVTGSTPSYFSGDKNPVDSVSYDAIRGSANGANWPSSNAVDSSSFVGKLRARTGLDFDLPTEAQWEYACRARTTTSYSYGNNTDGDYMWYVDNASSKTHEVGTKLPNAWGLYDMHGNVWEWCLDWKGALMYGVEPKGVSSGTDRIFRGGSWCDGADYRITSYGRYWSGVPSTKQDNIGFRLATSINESIPVTYCVIDLSAGTEASSYPVTYLATPPSDGFNVDEYKTTKLVLRRIEPGTFIMGDDQSDESHRVTLTKPFYIGLFEMTQKQYQLVTGSNPSGFSGDKLPVENVTYDAIRGSSNGGQYPSSNVVDSSSFLGKLRAQTGLDLDLPTEAQWEYACRAGTTTTYSYGNSANGNYMWHSSNSSAKTHAVGMKQPNFWGLYDMHGNVWEWCLDWLGSFPDGTDPKGCSTGTHRVVRGGSFNRDSSLGTSSHRDGYPPSLTGNEHGFRLARTVNESVSAGTLCSGESELVSFDLTPATPVISPEGGVVGSWPVSVSISCATEGVAIRFTTDGTKPTTESPLYSRFRVSQRTTVKAIAIKDGLVSEVAVAEYAAGQCANPVIVPANGTTFEHSGQAVSIAWQGEDGVLRYTTDGSDPTAESPVYAEPFTIDETTVVKAKVFGDQFFDSAIVTAALTRVWVNVATPVVTAASSFTGSKTQVSLFCATEGATIRYTLNGNEPNSHSTRYTGPFFVTNSCVVKAYAVCADYLNSEFATFAIEKVWGIGDTMGDPDQVFATGGDTPFFRVTDATAPFGESMQSGAITHSQTSMLSTAVSGPGTISFQWKTSCEDSGGQYDWDHAEFEVDGDVVECLDGETTWQTVSREISGNGPHTLVWRYVKDDMESEAEDCCWVADFRWTPVATPTYTATQTTPEPVPYTWLRGFYPETSDEYDAYESAALATAANGVNKVWECYVAGIIPTNEAARFEARIEVTNGIPVVTWSPDLNEGGTKNERVYTVEGKERLGDGWGPTNAASRFFRVKVALPGE